MIPSCTIFSFKLVNDLQFNYFANIMHGSCLWHIIIIPLFITFGDKNYGNITIKFKTLHIIYTYQIKLSLAPLGINDCLCLTVRNTGILRCAWLVLQDLKLWPWSTGFSKKRLQRCASDSRIRLNSFLVKFWIKRNVID